MLAIKTSAGVTPKMNLRNPLHKGEEAGKSGIHPDFESQGRLQQKSKIGASMALQKGLMPSKFKKNYNTFLFTIRGRSQTKRKRFCFLYRFMIIDLV